MITREYGKYFGACDLCDEVTPLFDTYSEARDYVRGHWKTTKDKETGEWENYCPECTQKLRRMKTLQDF